MSRNRSLFVLSMGAALAAASTMSFASSSNAERSIVGVWRTAVTIVNCQTGNPVGAPPIIGISTFNLGGTMSEWGIGPGTSPAQRSTSYGVWERDPGWRSYTFTFMHYRYDASGALIGSQTVTADAELGGNGRSYESVASVQILDVNNNVLANICATSVGTRFD